jgi:hypothetical protein
MDPILIVLIALFLAYVYLGPDDNVPHRPIRLPKTKKPEFNPPGISPKNVAQARDLNSGQ